MPDVMNRGAGLLLGSGITAIKAEPEFTTTPQPTQPEGEPPPIRLIVRPDLITHTGAIRAASGLLRRAEALAAGLPAPHRDAVTEAVARAQATLAAALVAAASVCQGGEGGRR
jgi:hypothetical protein